MPCTYTGSLEGDAALASQESIEYLSNELQRATRVACELGKLVATPVKNVLTSDETREWLKEHKQVDEKAANAKSKKKKA
jgi:hypothetical protein